MKTIQQSRLRLPQAAADKIYEVELCELPQNDAARYVVNFRYGSDGKALREGSKTPQPVMYDTAKQLFNSVVVAKINQGYIDSANSSAKPDGHGENSAVNTDTPTTPNTPVDANAIAKQTILRYLDAPPKHWPLSRIIWRAGEFNLHEAADKIAAIARNDHTLTHVSLWALGRCGNAKHLPMIEQILRDSSPDVDWLGPAVRWQLADEQQRGTLIQDLLQTLPAPIGTAITEGEQASLQNQLRDWLRPQKNSKRYHNNRIADAGALLGLINVYHLGQALPVCRQALEHLISDRHLSEPHFPAIRHLIQLCEMRNDSSMYAQLLKQISRFHPTAEGWQREGLTRQTLSYFQRRSWRWLRRLGQMYSPEYVPFARDILLSYSDDDAKPEQTISRYRWDWQNDQSITTRRHFGRFSQALAFSGILYHNSRQFARTSSGLSWEMLSTDADSGRTEAFPQLWDDAPEALLHLLCHSRCHEVHQFASRALADNTAFCQRLCQPSFKPLITLLSSDYEVTAALALHLVQQAFAQHPDTALIRACLQTRYAPANTQALAWLSAYPQYLAQDTDLCASALLNCQRLTDLTPLLTDLTLDTGQQQALLAAVITQLQDSTEANIDEAYLRTLVQQLQSLADDAVRHLPLSDIERLLTQPQPHLPLFGALLLLENAVAIGDIPADLLAHIQHSPDETVQSIGVSLLDKHSDTELLQQYPALLGFVLSEKPAIRTAVAPLIRRLVNADVRFADKILEDLIPYFFRAEPHEGLHADLLHLVDNALTPALANLNDQLRWRLLHAQCKAAQQLGAKALADINPTVYSVKQWAKLGDSDTLSVRQWCRNAYTNHLDIIKADAENALRLLNSRWPDSREFAMDYFRRHFTDNDWQPALIIGICDSTFDEVQRFGRELLTRFFQAGDGVTYLTHLSQHPGQNVQLFTSNFLANYAADNVSRLRQLTPYFITVLSQVARGRISKDRVIAFLNQEALKNIEAAQVVAAIYTRQSVTLSIKDKTHYINGMHALKQAYPEVDLPIILKPLAVKGQGNRSVTAEA